MQIKINDKILSIPPYVSAHWSSIISIQMKGETLAITLNDGGIVSIPELPKEAIEQIFNYHAAFLEKGSFPSTVLPASHSLIKEDALQNLFDSPNPIFKLGFGSLDGTGHLVQHNPQQSDAPDLPPEVLQKIGAISKILASEDLGLPAAVSACNCFYCQIARAINPLAPKKEDQEEVTDADLHFPQWIISQIGDKLFSVTSGSDENEKYNVYLGEPLGCTCGKQGCEHIIAVLKS